MIRIKSKHHLFRRCGVAHPKDPVEYPDGRFSEEELGILKAEPMLVVEELPDAEGSPPPPLCPRVRGKEKKKE